MAGSAGVNATTRQSLVADLETKILAVANKLDGNGETLAVADLDNGLALLDEVHAYLQLSVSGANAKEGLSTQHVVVMGATGAGKSTVASFLFGEGRTLVHHESKSSRVLIAQKPLPGVDIQSGPRSRTLLPVFNRVQTLNTEGDEEVDIVLWDMPGGDDTRGPFVELVVHFVFKWLLKDKNIKFIVASAPVYERQQEQALARLLESSLVRADNTIVVYTKCSADFDTDRTLDLEIAEEKRAIRSFALRMPAKSDVEGQDYSAQYHNTKTEVLDALANLQVHAVEYDEPLPEPAQNLMAKLCESSIEFARDVLSSCFLAVYSSQTVHVPLCELHELIGDLGSARELRFEEIVAELSRIGPVVAGGLRFAGSLKVVRRRLAVMEVWMGRAIRRYKTAWMTGDCQMILAELKSELKTLRATVTSYRNIDEDTNRKTLVISALRLQLSHELPRIQDFMRSANLTMLTQQIHGVDRIPTIVLVGVATLDVDATFDMWTNLVLVSPSVHVLPGVAVDLSAVGEAPSPVPSRANPGQTGVHGSPGLPGGNLVVVCRDLDDEGLVLRSSTSNGQNGGAGQDGGNGINGRDAVYSLADFNGEIKASVEQGLLWHDGNVKLPTGMGLAESRSEVQPGPSNFLWGMSVCPSLAAANRVAQAVGTAAMCFGAIVTGVIAFQKATQFSTRIEMILERRSQLGSRGVPPGPRGRGGRAGMGGTLQIFEANGAWEGRGASGEEGRAGSPGRSSRDGVSSAFFVATVRLQYSSTSLEGMVLVSAEETPVPPPREMASEAFKSGNGANAVDNCCVQLVLVKTQYQAQRARMESKFGWIDFTDLRGINDTTE